MIEHLPNDHFGGPDEETVRRGHELDKVSVKSVLVTAAVLISVVVGSLFFLTFLKGRLREGAPQPQTPTAWQRAERPAVDNDQAAQLRALRAWEERALKEYHWQDEDQSVAAIPVERAMQIMLEKGVPFPQGEDASRVEPGRGTTDEDADAGDRTKQAESPDSPPEPPAAEESTTTPTPANSKEGPAKTEGASDDEPQAKSTPVNDPEPNSTEPPTPKEEE